MSSRLLQNARKWAYLNANYYALRRTPTIVYSMQRSGSVAVFTSLQDAGIFTIAGHCFDLDKDGPGQIPGGSRWAIHHILKQTRPINVISLVRNPVENMVSVFARKHFVKRAGIDAQADQATAPLTDDALAAAFTQQFCSNHSYRQQLDWFQDEFNKVLGVDVYQHPFDSDRQLAQFAAGRMRVLLLRTELASEAKGAAIAEFLGLPRFVVKAGEEVVRTGGSHATGKGTGGTAGSQSPYAREYDALRQRVRLPRQYWDEILASRYSQHFFSAQELAETERKYVTGEGSRG